MEVELHSSTVQEIRESLVGKVAHVRLKEEQRHGGQGGASNKISRKGRHNGVFNTSCFGRKEESSKDSRSLLLLTVDSVEVSHTNDSSETLCDLIGYILDAIRAVGRLTV